MLWDPGGGRQEEMKSELEVEGGQYWVNGTSSMTKGKNTDQHRWGNINYNLFSGEKGQLPDYMVVGQGEGAQQGVRAVLREINVVVAFFSAIFLNVDDFQ